MTLKLDGIFPAIRMNENFFGGLKVAEKSQTLNPTLMFKI